MKAVTLLKEHHLRKTDFRKEVLEIFLAHKGRALSHADLEMALDSPDRITLYRTLRSFEEKGLIHQAIDGSGTNKYALCRDDCTAHIHLDRHAHFHCQKCGLTLCLFHAMKDFRYQLPEGMKASSAEVIIKGVCEDCS